MTAELQQSSEHLILRGPQQFGRYTVLATIARGGMGYVHLAAIRGAHGFRKIVVVKELSEELHADPDFRAMFLQEGNIAARLSHPNIVQTYEAGDEGERLFIVMEYLPGQPLNRIKRKVPYDELLQFQLLAISDMLAGLAHAHALQDYDGTPFNLVHRDVSPHNVFVTYAGEVKVVDFGVAKAANQLGGNTKTGTIKGKIAYMPPEQATGSPIDARADLFAAGIMIYEAVTGKRFWAGHEELAAFGMLLRGKLPDWRPEVIRQAPAFVSLLSRVLTVDPEERFRSAAEFKEELDVLRRKSNAIPAREDLGKLLEIHFTGEREERTALLRAQLAAMETGDGPASLLDTGRASDVSGAVARTAPTNSRPSPANTFPPSPGSESGSAAHRAAGAAAVAPASSPLVGATLVTATNAGSVSAIGAGLTESTPKAQRGWVVVVGFAALAVIMAIFGILILRKLDENPANRGVLAGASTTAPVVSGGTPSVLPSTATAADTVGSTNASTASNASGSSTGAPAHPPTSVVTKPAVTFQGLPRPTATRKTGGNELGPNPY
jgi:eukaryotic-like serine/threonine-protein kinase